MIFDFRFGQSCRFEAQGTGVYQGVLSTMTDEETVYLDIERQVRFAFVGLIEHLRRMMKRREIDATEVDIIVRLLVGDRYPFLQDDLTSRRRHNKPYYPCYHYQQQ